MNSEIENELKPYLATDEKFLWTGKPRQGIRFEYFDIGVILFMALWSVGIIYMFRNVLNSPDPTNKLILGAFILFVFITSTISLYREISERLNQIYGITNTRIIIKSKVKSEMKSISVRDIQVIKIIYYNSGAGTIKLNKEWIITKGWGRIHARKVTPPQFFNISDVQTAYNLIITLQQNQ